MSKPPEEPQASERGSEAELDAVQQARRRLLRLGLYVAPAVLGTLLIGRDALAQASCAPARCQPVASGCAPATCRPRAP